MDPDLEAVWQEQDDEGGLETLDGVWSRTAARLERGDAKETPYELNSDNRFSELSDPFEEGVRLFEEGQIADAALCFEAEIARNPENSQVCCCPWGGIYVAFVLRRYRFGWGLLWFGSIEELERERAVVALLSLGWVLLL